MMFLPTKIGHSAIRKCPYLIFCHAHCFHTNSFSEAPKRAETSPKNDQRVLKQQPVNFNFHMPQNSSGQLIQNATEHPTKFIQNPRFAKNFIKQEMSQKTSVQQLSQ